MIFQSEIQHRGTFPCEYPDSVVKNETMFFNCDLDYAYKHGHDITRHFLDGLPEDWKLDDVVLDSRVHMLMPGWYPCIPGWHHDDVPRSTPTGQPNYENPEYHAEHLIGLVNGSLAPTEFALGRFEMSEPDINSTIYQVWHKEVQRQLHVAMCLDFNNPVVTQKFAESGEYIQFDAHAFHTGTKAVGNGWRWFIRLSRNTDRVKYITNEIRHQVQVYMDDPTQGW
jgi:hypothetical protein